MRFDRTLSLLLARTVYRSPQQQDRVPVLMYHSISDDPETSSRPYYRLCTPPALFREHLSILSDLGYRSVSLRQALHPDGVDHPCRRAAITFDDGFRDFATHAWPLLTEHGFSATVFLPTAFISDRRQPFLGRECLTWEEVRLLDAAGVEFGSHTINHNQLWRLSHAELWAELRDSKQTIEQELQHEVVSFSHPFAFPSSNRAYVTRLRELLRTCGYHAAVTTKIGTYQYGADLLEVPRLHVNSSDDPEVFRAKLSGAYDWMGKLQALSKTVRASRNPCRRPEAAAVQN